MIFVCQVTLQDHVISDSSVGDCRHCGSGDILVLVCHVISQDSRIKGLCDFVERIPSWKVTTLPRLVAIATAVVEI